MKMFVFIAVFLISGSTAFNQTTEIIAADTIVHIAGQRKVVKVSHITATKIFYTYPGRDNVFEIDRNQVERIIYHGGRVEVLNRPAFQMLQEGDWRTVFITKNEQDVEGLYLRGEVTARAAAAKNRKETIRNAEIRLKKQAAGMNANIIYLTNTEFQGGFGDVPSITLRGRAYGFTELIVPEKEKEVEEIQE